MTGKCIKKKVRFAPSVDLAEAAKRTGTRQHEQRLQATLDILEDFDEYGGRIVRLCHTYFLVEAYVDAVIGSRGRHNVANRLNDFSCQRRQSCTTTSSRDNSYTLLSSLERKGLALLMELDEFSAEFGKELSPTVVVDTSPPSSNHLDKLLKRIHDGAENLTAWDL